MSWTPKVAGETVASADANLWIAALGGGKPVQPASYTIFLDGTTYKARNGTTGIIDFSGTNAMTVIQAVIDALTDGSIYIKGSLSGTTTLTIDGKRISLFGDSMYSSKLNFSGNIDGLKLLNTSFLTVENLALIGDNSLCNKGLWMESCSNIHVRNVILEKWKDDAALYMKSCVNCSFVNVYPAASTYALYLDTANNNNHFYACRFRSSTNGILVNAHANTGNGFHGCDISANTGSGVKILNGSRKIIFDGCWFEVNTGYGIEATGSDVNYLIIKVKDSVFYTQTTHISLDYFRVAVVDHNYFEGGTTCLAIGGGSNYDIFISNNEHDTDPANFVTGTALRTRFKSNYGYVTENNGTSTGTGAEQTIAHGLVTTPKSVVIIPTASGATVSGLYAKDTNFYVTVTSGKTYNWYASL